jgi:hypothetical protein
MGSDSIIGNREPKPEFKRQNSGGRIQKAEFRRQKSGVRRDMPNLYKINDLINSLKSFDRSMLGYRAEFQDAALA